MGKEAKGNRDNLDRELSELLRRIEDWLETPMIVLAFVWLGLITVEFIWGLSPLLQVIVQVIWGIFVFDFLLRFLVAPRKGVFLGRNVLTLVSLVLPAVRILRAFRMLRFLRVTRGLRLVRVISSLNRGMQALGGSMRRRGAQYVIALAVITLLVGAAGMYAFELDAPRGQGFDSYGEALWWTAMLLTTVGSENWPQTAEGRILCLLLSLFGLAILGYITAVLAGFFIGRDVGDEAAEIAELRNEIDAMHATLRQLVQQRDEPI